MVFMSRGKKETEDMASPGLNRSFMDDSLENGEWRAAAAVGPETLNGDANYFAFSGESELHLGLFPHYVVNLLQDKSSWKNRVSGIDKIRSVIDGIQDSTVLESNLAMIVELVTGPLGDTHFKVAQTGLQLVESLVSQVGGSLGPYLTTLVPGILAKMGSNKYAIKQVGMRVVMLLMRHLRPEQVVREVGSCGLRHKTSRVREESNNIIIAALLTFPKTDFRLFPLVREVSPGLYDSKQKVRQASLEALALLTSMLEQGDLKHIVAAIASVDPTKKAGLEGNESTVMKAFQARLSRQTFPRLNQDGLVEHAVRVASGKAPHAFSGPDVEWILTAGQVKASVGVTTVATPLSNGVSQPNGGVSSGSTFRPYRSAGRRLPWEKDAAGDGESTAAAAAPPRPSGMVVNSQWNGLQATPTLPTHLKNPPLLSPVVPPASTWLHPPPKRASVAGATPVATTRSLKKSSPSYTDLHLAKLQHGVNATPTGRPLPLSRSSRRASLNVPLGPPGTSSGVARKNSLPNGSLAPLPDQEGAGGEGFAGVVPDGRYPPSFVRPGVPLELQGGGGLGTSPGMSVSWPRSRGGPTSFVRASQQISADASVAVGVQGSVRTNVIRPLSKPRVRNPITLLTQKQQHQQPAVPRLSPTQLEQEFLLSSGAGAAAMETGPTPWAGEGLDEEEYYTIPEDTAVLDSSLSSSLCSLYGISRELDTAKTKEIDKLKHIRRQAASRKAQLLSTSNSPDLSGTPPRHSSGEGEKGWMQSSVSAPTKKSKKKAALTTSQSQSQPHSTVNLSAAGGIGNENPPVKSLDLDLSRTYVVTEAESDSRHIQAAECESKKQKKLSGKSKSTSHGKRISPTEEPDTVTYRMSLQGYGLNQGGQTGEVAKEGQPRKKSRKVETMPRGNVPPKVRSKSLGCEAQQRRPSIEQGGTNTIEMEVSGVGSLRGDVGVAGYPAPPSLSQATKESIVRKKQKQLEQHSPPDEGTSPKTLSATYPSSKPPLPPQAIADMTTTSAPLQHVKQRRRRGRSYSNPSSHSGHQLQTESGYVTAGDETPKQQFPRTNGGDSPGAENGSPNGTALEELHPFGNPEQALREAMRNLEGSDWTGKCDGMVAVRRMAMFHPEVLGPQLHSAVLAVQQEVKNLRSTVARGAIACLGDLFALMGRAMEQDLDSLVSVLLRKGADSSAFIREDVEKALTEMVASVSPGKSLLALIAGGLAHRSVQVRKTASRFMCASVERYGPGRLLSHGSRDVVERTLTAIVQLVGDANPDCRYYGRKSLNQLWSQPDFDRVAARVLSDQLLGRTREAIDNLKAKGVGDPPSESHSAKHHSSRHSTGGSVRMSTNGTPSSGGHKNSVSEQGANSRAASGAAKEGSSKRSRKHHSSTQELPSLVASEVPLPDRLCERMKASDWNTRYEAVSELESFVDAYPTALGPHLRKVFDAFSPRLTDRNSKVNLHALQAFSNIIPLLGNGLVPVLNNVITALLPNLASRNGTIHSIALTVLDLLSQCVDAHHLLQPVATNGQYSNARVQPIMIKKLAELTTLAFDQKPQLVKRQVLPVMWHLLTAKTSASAEAKSATLVLCAALYDLMGQSFLDGAGHLSPEHQRQLEELVLSLNR